MSIGLLYKQTHVRSIWHNPVITMCIHLLPCQRFTRNFFRYRKCEIGSRSVESNRSAIPGGDGNVKHAEDKGTSGPLWHWLGCGKVRKRRNASSLPTFSHSRIMIYQFELESIALHCPNVYTSMPRSDSTLSIDGTRHPPVASSFATLDSRHLPPCLISVHWPSVSRIPTYCFWSSPCSRLVIIWWLLLSVDWDNNAISNDDFPMFVLALSFNIF